MNFREVRALKFADTRGDVFLMEWEKKFAHFNDGKLLRPREALAIISRCLAVHKANHMKERAIGVFVSISAKHGVWCAVTWERLHREMRAKNLGNREFIAIDNEIDAMIRDGLLEVPGYRRWYSSWLNQFYRQLICPTQKLIDIINVIRKSQEPTGSLVN